MKKEALYKDFAKYYDLIYSFKDYKREVDELNKIISKYKKSSENDLLEVGCGSGKHLYYFKDKFDCVGIDVNKGVLNLARRNIKGVNFKHANMVNFSLDKKFDVITCLFSSIGYVKNYSNLKKTIEGFSKHLKKGGLVIIEPWFTKDSIRPGKPHMHTYNSENLKIARIIMVEIKKDISILNMHFLVGEKDKGVNYFLDKHELALFSHSKTLDIMKSAGLKASYLKDGLMKDRGLFIGIKQ